MERRGISGIGEPGSIEWNVSYVEDVWIISCFISMLVHVKRNEG